MYYVGIGVVKLCVCGLYRVGLLNEFYSIYGLYLLQEGFKAKVVI